MTRSRTASELPAGLAYTASAYFMWGLLALYLVALRPTSPLEIVAWRIVLSLLVCLILVTVVRGWHRLWALLRDRRALGWLAFASVAVGINWLIFVIGTDSGHVVEVSLGYFINPVFTVLLGVLLLRERLRSLQWTAVGVSVLAVVVLSAGLGAVPWIAIGLAVSFGFYGFAKNRVGPRADAISGLTVETGLLTPASVILLLVFAANGNLDMGKEGQLHTVLLLGSGVITAVPLIFFAAGARRIPLSYLGLLQYLAPTLQFITGIAILNESMPPERWLGFGIVWAALLLLAVDGLAHGARQRRKSVSDPADAVGEVT